MRFSPTVIAREIEAQSRRLHKVLATGERSIDLRIIQAEGDGTEWHVVQDYAYSVRDDLKRLNLILLPTGKFLDKSRMWQGGPGFELPRIDGVAPLMDAPTDPFPEVEAIYAAREADERKMRDARDGVDRKVTPKVRPAMSNEEAIARVEAYRAGVAEADRAAWVAKMIERIRALDEMRS